MKVKTKLMFVFSIIAHVHLNIQYDFDHIQNMSYSEIIFDHF